MKEQSKNAPISKKKQAAGHIAIYSVGSIARQLVGFIMLPIYTRLLSPADYGIVALLSVLISIFELAIGARFVRAIPRFFYETTDDTERSSTISTALIITSTTSLVGVILLATNGAVASTLLFGVPDYAIYVATYSVLLLTTAVENYGLTYIRLLERPLLFITVSIGKLILQLSLNILLVVFLRLGVAGVIISAIVSSAIFCLLMAFFIIIRTGLRFDTTLAKRLIRFTWPLWLAGGASLYIGASSRFFIRIFSDLSDVGLFELAARFASLVGFLVWGPFSQWWQTERFALYQRDDHGQPVFRAIFNLITCVTLLACVGISLFADSIIKIMADANFHTASLAVPPLAFAAVVRHAALFYNFSFLAKDKVGFIASIKYFEAIAMTILMLLLIPKYGFLGAAYALFAANTLVFLVTYYYAQRTYDSGARFGTFAKMFVAGILIVGIDTLQKPESEYLVSLAMKCLLTFVYIGILATVIHLDKSTRFLTKTVLSTIQKGSQEFLARLRRKDS